MSTLAVEPLPVLVVDDDEMLAHTLEDILRLRGFAPRTAGSGRRALAIAREMTPPPVVAVVDLRLPDMDGLDLATELHALSSNIQVVILTGNATVETAIRALRDKNCDYLVKPVEPEQLVRTLRLAEGRWRLSQTEDELRHAQGLLRTVFDASPLPILAIDTRFIVQLWNRAAEEVFGWRAEEVIGHPLPLLGPEHEPEAQGFLLGAWRGESVTGVEVRRRRRDGTLIDLRLSTAPLEDAAGGAYGLLAVYEDITERRRMEEHLGQAQRLDALGRLAGGIAHDFNNLLAAILGETELALPDSEAHPALYDCFKNINHTAQRGATLTRQLLAFARRQPVEAVVFSANDMVTDVDWMLRRLVSDKVQLEIRLAPDLWPVRGDRGQLEQVVTNLVVNARDAMPNGGSVVVTTRNVVVAEEGAVPDDEAGDWVVVSVTDTGTGMTDEVRERLFEPFFTTKERGAGTGLGLATSYGIVQRFGGRIDVDTKLNHGSTFHVYLPRAHGTATRAAERGTPATPAGSESILLVEDHNELRNVTRRILVRQGYSVEVAENGEEALRIAEGMQGPPDLLLTDAHLPDCDGGDIIWHLRRRWPKLRVLLTSGALDVAKDSAAGVRLLAKPYSLEQLAREVRSVLDAPA